MHFLCRTAVLNGTATRSKKLSGLFSMNIHRYYEILEIDTHASPETVRQAYEDLLLAWDPKAFSKSPHLKKKAEKKIEEIHEAYQKIVSFSSVIKEPDVTKKRPPHEDISFGSHRLKPVSVTEPGSSGRISLRAHPWMRFSARIIDYLLFAFVLQWMHLFRMSVWEHVPSFFFPVVVTFLWIFVEAMLLHLFGTTIGKWIFGIEIIDRFLKKPGYWSACLRSLSVWCNGVGTGFFLIAPATFAVSYVRLRRDGIAPWDRMGKFHTIHAKIESRRMLTAGLCITAVLTLAFQFEKRGTGSIPVKVMQQKGGNTEPGSEKTSLAKANSYLLMGRYDEAGKAYRSIIMENPNLAEARYGLGVSHAKNRRYKAAIEELKQAVRLAPEYAEAHHILGLVYLTFGDRDAALTHYRILLNLDEELAEELHVYIRNMENFVENESVPSK